MSKHIVFLIHGIGQHSPDWAKVSGGPLDVLRVISQRYVFFQKHSLEEFVDFVPLYYDNIIDDAIAKWRSDEQAILSAGVNIVPSFQSIGSWLDSVPEKAKELFWSYVADIGVYRLLPAYRQRIRTELINSIAQKVEATFSVNGTSPQSTVIAHSLGTTVAHDVVHALGATRWGGNDNPYGPRHWRFNAIFMLANTIGLLASEYAPYLSMTKPGPLASPDSFCSRYYNVRHKFDPIPIPRMFSPPDWGSDLKTIEVDHFREINVHGLGHYLAHPMVHIPLLRTIVNPGAVTRDEETQVQDFPKWEIPGLKSELRQHLSKGLSKLVEELKGKTQIDEVVHDITDYYSLVTEIHDSLSK